MRPGSAAWRVPPSPPYTAFGTGTGTGTGTGAAGVALVLAHDTVGALGYLPVPGLSGVLEPAPEPPGVCVPVS